MATSTIGCSGCPNRWTGLTTSHCSGCHETFSNLKGFDAHRKYYKCVRPSASKFTEDDGIWHLIS